MQFTVKQDFKCGKHNVALVLVKTNETRAHEFYICLKGIAAQT